MRHDEICYNCLNKMADPQYEVCLNFIKIVETSLKYLKALKFKQNG